MQIRRKPRPGEMPKHLAHSLYSGGLGAYDPGGYRSTPSGAPDVAALVHPGMMIRTSDSTGGTVIAVEGPHVHVAPDGKDYPHFTIAYVPSERFGGHGRLDRNWINECVTVNGRILKLLEANLDEVFIEGPVSGPG
jgi:hypothetical protein